MSHTKDEFLERIIDLLENGVPDLSGKGWKRDITTCPEGHSDYALRSDGRRYCITCNRNRKKKCLAPMPTADSSSQ